MKSKPRVLAVMAHPDDIEMTCAGTLALLKRAGWDIHMASMTAGDLGSATRSRAEISRIRRKEATASAKLLGAGYTCLGFDDLTIVYGETTKRRVSALLRQVRPDLVIVPSPVDYMADHEETPRIVREAAFASTVPNWKASLRGKSPPPCDKVPGILYADPIDNIDHFGRRVRVRYVVDITTSVDFKEKMLAAHDSQRSWLREQHGEDEYLRWMRRVGADRARDFRDQRVEYAEGFRPHLGHGFPREDYLTASLGKRVVKTLLAKGE
jgi:LmbE family N-acetylglucosaminyl deacetylase